MRNARNWNLICAAFASACRVDSGPTPGPLLLAQSNDDRDIRVDAAYAVLIANRRELPLRDRVLHSIIQNRIAVRDASNVHVAGLGDSRLYVDHYLRVVLQVVPKL